MWAGNFSIFATPFDPFVAVFIERSEVGEEFFVFGRVVVIGGTSGEAGR